MYSVLRTAQARPMLALLPVCSPLRERTGMGHIAPCSALYFLGLQGSGSE